MRRKVGVDNDECLAEFVYGFLCFHNQIYGTSFYVMDVSSYNLWEILDCDKQESIRRVHEFYGSCFFPNLPVTLGSREVSRRLSIDNDLFVITSRPEIIKEATLRWLSYHFPDIFKEVIFTNEWNLNGNRKNKTKGEICLEREISYLIEDNLDYARECSEKGVRVFLLDKPWNRSDVNGNVTRVQSWYEILEKIE